MSLKTNRELIFHLFVFLVLVFNCVFSTYQIMSILSLLIFIFSLYYWIRKNPEVILKYLAYVFMMGASISGVIIIEFTDIYLIELERSSQFAGSLPLIILGYWVMFFVFSLNCRKVKTYGISEFNNLKLRNICVYGMLLALISYSYLLYPVLQNPAFVLHVDRFIYSDMREIDFVSRFLTNMAANFLLFPLLLLNCTDIKKIHKICAYLTISLYVLYFLCVGDKFGPFFTCLCISVLVNYNTLKSRGPKYLNKKIMTYAISFFLVILMPLIVDKYTQIPALDYLMRRTSQQGQMWWGTYDICSNYNIEGDFSNELKAIFEGKKSVKDNINAKHGIYNIMYLVAPRERVDWKLSTGSLYTEAGFASVYFYFGVVGVVVFAFFMGKLIAWTIDKFLLACARNNIFIMLLSLRLFQIERSALSAFNFYDLLAFTSVVSIITLLFYNKKRVFIRQCNS